MSRILLATSVAVVLVACGGSSKPAATQTTPGDGVAGDASGGGGPTCEPGRCLEDIAKLVAERRSDARACYDEARKADPALPGGTVIINFAIDSEGVVGETSQGMQDGQLEAPGIVACISEVIKTVRFAASPAGKTTRAYHRFEFNP